MDPGTMMLLSSLVSGGLGALTGQKEKHGSTYSSGQRSKIEQMLGDLSNMRGGGSQDITQNQNYQQGQDWLGSLYNDQDFFKNIEAPAFRQLNEDILPGIANRFAGMGSGGSTGSTAFRNQANRAGTDLATNLAAQRTGMQQQGVNQSMNYAQAPFNNYMQLLQSALQPTQNTYQGADSGGWGALAAPFAQGATTYWGQNMGNMGGGGQNMNNSGQGSAAGWDNMFRQTGLPPQGY